MASQSTNRTTDIFAEIAAGKASTARADLVTPQPLPVPDTVLPLNGAKEAQFQPLEKVDSAEKLQAELENLRTQMAPYLQNHAPAVAPTRKTVELTEFDWREETEADRQGFLGVLHGDGDWEAVRIPHYGEPLGRAVTYYRTTFKTPACTETANRLLIRFNGVDYKAHVFINDAYLGSHEGFFAPFEFDFTAHARTGENVLVVKVENDAICMGNNSWGGDGKEFEGDKLYAATGPGYDDPEIGWHHCPPGMGIYQAVQVETRPTLFIHDIFVRPLPDQDAAEAWIELWNCDIRRRPARLQLSVYGQNFEGTVCEDLEVELPGPLGPRVNYGRFRLAMPEHRLWEPGAPWLYQLQVKLLNEDGVLLDTAKRQFGMRSFRMDTETIPRGRLFLNGKPIRLRGTNTMGHEQIAVMQGDTQQLHDDILLTKLCNMNFWRLTQRPVQREVYEACDRLGLMTQTDLPLFGFLRRNQVCEAVRQAEEMERVIRCHPCSIMVSYINEPFADRADKAHRHLVRSELEAFFQAADMAVHLANPDRVIKPVDGDYDPPAPGLPDNHCYCGWYNGHGVDLGLLHKGQWQPVKPDWLYACGEYGAEGLDPADLMRRRYPTDWLPQAGQPESRWTPQSIVKAQTGSHHCLWFDAQDSLEDWVRASQEHQAWATRIMTEAFRRDPRMVSCALHLLIDAWPAGWMKTLVDSERVAKPAYFACRKALTPLMVNLRTDRLRLFGGDIARVEAWICNDTNTNPVGAQLVYRGEIDGQVIASGRTEAQIPQCSSLCQGVLNIPVPQVSSRTPLTVRLALIGPAGEVLQDTAIDLELFPSPASLGLRVSVVGGVDGQASGLARALGCRLINGLSEDADVLIIDNLEAFRKVGSDVEALVRQGMTAVFMALPEGTHELCGIGVTVESCGMGPRHFVSRATGHPLVHDFLPHDFRFWYSQETDCPAPLLNSLLKADKWETILATGQVGWGIPASPAAAVVEHSLGRGMLRICQLRLVGRIDNPIAWDFASRLLRKAHEES